MEIPFHVGDRVAWRKGDCDYVGAVERVIERRQPLVVVVVDRRNSDDESAPQVVAFRRRASGDYTPHASYDGTLRLVGPLSPRTSP